MSLRSLGLSLAVAVSALIAGAPALADDAADTATARALGIEGVTLANAGNCRDAIEKLERAEKLHHAPTTATRLGECEIALGRLVRGTERLRRVVREPLAPNAHAAFGAAVAQAQRVLDVTLPRIATLHLSVEVPRGTRLAIAIDGESTSDAIVDTDRRIDPGSHTIQISADGFFPSTVTASLGEGQSKSVVVALRADPNARPTAQGDGDVTASTADLGGETRGSKVPALVAFGLGGIGLGVGIYGAVVVDDKARTLATGCDANRVCPPELRGELGAAKTWANVSTAGFIAGGAGVATGLVLLLLSSGTSTSSTAPRGGVRVRPSVAATSVGLDGVF